MHVYVQGGVAGVAESEGCERNPFAKDAFLSMATYLLRVSLAEIGEKSFACACLVLSDMHTYEIVGCGCACACESLYQAVHVRVSHCTRLCCVVCCIHVVLHVNATSNNAS